ncbi:hypothetical protein K439DRAFT_1643105, partial [Ramaria rubella]
AHSPLESQSGEAREDLRSETFDVIEALKQCLGRRNRSARARQGIVLGPPMPGVNADLTPFLTALILCRRVPILAPHGIGILDIR